MKTRVRKQAGDRFLIGTSMGLLAAILICLISSILMAILVGNERITEEGTKVTTAVTHVIAGLMASVVSGSIALNRKGLASIACVCSYIAVLLMITILLFDGMFDNVILTMASIFAGYGLSKIPLLRKRKGSIRLKGIKIAR